jgi:hypothetical protein
MSIGQFGVHEYSIDPREAGCKEKVIVFYSLSQFLSPEMLSEERMIFEIDSPFEVSSIIA